MAGIAAVIGYRSGGRFGDGMRRRKERNFYCALAAVCLAGAVWRLSAGAALAWPYPAGKPVLTLTGAAPGPGGLQPVAIFGKDNRREIPERYSGLEGKIGMIYEPSTQTLCTAFCVAPGIVATAAHCLFQQKNGKFPELAELTFRLDYGKVSASSSLAGANTGSAKHYIAVGTTVFNQDPPLSAPKDWALAKLEHPVCRFGALQVIPKGVTELVEAAQQGRVFQLAYHWDFQRWRLAYSEPCAVSRDFNDIKWPFIRQHFVNPQELVLHDCDTGGASSGSPILLDTPAGPVAVAINVGTYTRTRLFLRDGRVVRRLKPDTIANTGVNATAFEHVIAAMEQARILASVEEIKSLQAELQARGLYKGQADGHFGRDTRSAIRAFEGANGFPVTGLPTASILVRLGENRVKPAVTYSTVRGARP